MNPRPHTTEELEVIARSLARLLQQTAMNWMREHHGPGVLYMQDAAAVVRAAFDYNTKGITASMQFVTAKDEGAPH